MHKYAIVPFYEDKWARQKRVGHYASSDMVQVGQRIWNNLRLASPNYTWGINPTKASRGTKETPVFHVGRVMVRERVDSGGENLTLEPPAKGCNYGGICLKHGVSHGPPGMQSKHHTVQSKLKTSESNKLAQNSPELLAKKASDAARQGRDPVRLE